MMPLVVFVPAVHQAHLTHGHQAGFVVEIFPEVRVLVGPDVVRGYVGKQSVVKEQSVGPVHFDALGGHLHDHVLAARLHHVRKGLVELVGLGRGVQVGRHPVADHGAVGADHAHLFSRRLQYGFDHMSGGGLALCARDAHGDHLSRRITEPGG